MAVTIANLSDKNGNIREIAPKGLNHDVTFTVSGLISGTATATKLYSNNGSNLTVNINTTNASIPTNKLTGTIATSQIEDGSVTKAKLGTDIATDSVTDGSSKLLTSNGAYDNLVKKAGDTMTGTLSVKPASGSTDIRCIKAGSSTDERINLSYSTDGTRGLWDSKLSDYVLKVNSSNNATLAGKADAAGTADSSKRVQTSDEQIYDVLPSSDTRYLYLGDINFEGTSSAFHNVTLLLQNEFWGNGRCTSDIITLSFDAANGDNMRVTSSRLNLSNDGTNLIDYYYQINTGKHHLYAHVPGGNGYGRWSVSVLAGDCTFTGQFQGNKTRYDNWIAIGYKGYIANSNHANTADAATNATNAVNASNANRAISASSADTATTATNANYATNSGAVNKISFTLNGSPSSSNIVVDLY